MAGDSFAENKAKEDRFARVVLRMKDRDDLIKGLELPNLSHIKEFEPSGERIDKISKIDGWFNGDRRNPVQLRCLRKSQYDVKVKVPFPSLGFPIRTYAAYGESELDKLLDGQMDDVIFIFGTWTDQKPDLVAQWGPEYYQKVYATMGKTIRIQIEKEGIEKCSIIKYPDGEGGSYIEKERVISIDRSQAGIGREYC